MDIDQALLKQFEKELNPQDLNTSSVPATCIGYGEISAIFTINGNETIAYKRMPLFKSRKEAEKYERMYHEYCRLLIEAGLKLPENETYIIEVPERPVSFYIAQSILPVDRFCHKLVHTLDENKMGLMLEDVAGAILNIREFNKLKSPSLELAIDGQLSNWVWIENSETTDLYYIDTSTPLFRIDGVEQQDPELLLQSAPSFLRWLIRMSFLDDVMNRYYDFRLIFTDLVGNLHKEQRPDLIPFALNIVNRFEIDGKGELTSKEIDRYYREDKLIWSLFLGLRRLDRFLKINLFRERYEFILPGKINR